MAAKHARDLSLPLSFLGAENYSAKIWKDAPDSESEPNHLVTEALPVSARDELKLHVALDGGFVAELQPAHK